MSTARRLKRKNKKAAERFVDRLKRGDPAAVRLAEKSRAFIRSCIREYKNPWLLLLGNVMPAEPVKP